MRTSPLSSEQGQGSPSCAVTPEATLQVPVNQFPKSRVPSDLERNAVENFPVETLGKHANVPKAHGVQLQNGENLPIGPPNPTQEPEVSDRVIERNPSAKIFGLEGMPGASITVSTQYDEETEETTCIFQCHGIRQALGVHHATIILHWGCRNTGDGSKRWELPPTIPEGSKIAADNGAVRTPFDEAFRCVLSFRPDECPVILQFVLHLASNQEHECRCRHLRDPIA